jgi:hypothetical protein
MASARRPRTSARPAAAANKSAEGGSGGGVAAEREYYDGGEKSKQRVSNHLYSPQNKGCIIDSVIDSAVWMEEVCNRAGL